jgi:DNA-binding GntR family transcriptional regulator
LEKGKSVDLIEDDLEARTWEYPPAPASGQGGLIRAQTHYQRVRDALRRDIIAGHFSGNERLIVANLCERYGISAPPIREALSQLQVEGLVVLEANRGARVRPVTRAFVAEIFEIRIALEPYMVERSVPLLTDQRIEALKAIQVEFANAIRTQDHFGVLRGNGRFHRCIYNARANQEAMRLLDQHSAVIATMRNRFGYRKARFETIIAEHEMLIAACAERDTVTATAIARRHIEHSVDDLLGLMQDAGIAHAA